MTPSTVNHEEEEKEEESEVVKMESDYNQVRKLRKIRIFLKIFPFQFSEIAN